MAQNPYVLSAEDLQFTPSSFDTLTEESIVDSKLKSVSDAAAQKAAELFEWNRKGLPEKLGLGVLAGTERALGNVIQAPGNIAQSFAQGTLEPESVLMQNQAIDAENKLRNLSRQINGGVSSPAMLREQAIEQERFNQAKSWLSQPINTEKTSGIFGKLAPQLFGSDYTRADALAGNERLTEAVSAPAMFGDALKESAASRVNQGQYETVNPIFDEAATAAAKGWKEGNAVTGAAKFVGESLLGIAKAVIADPESSAVKMSESLINTITAAHPLAATINYGGLFTDGRATAYKDFQKEHGGKLPTASESAIIDTAIGASVLSELAGDVLQIKMVPLLQKVLKNSPDTIPTSVKADLVAKFPKLQELAKETGKIAAIPALEGTQGGFQELADQYAVKQDLDKIDSKKVARGAIEEGFAAAAMGGAAAVSTPGAVSTAGRKNDTLKQSTEASEAFKATEAYKPFTEVKEAPVAAFRAFEKVVADQASTLEQKQAAFDTAFGSLVNTPQFNTQKIASSLIEQLKTQPDLTVEGDVANTLSALAKPIMGTVAKVGDTVTKTVDKGLTRIRTNADKNAEITDELIQKDPVFAMELLSNKEIKYTDQASYEKVRGELIETFSKINKASSKGISEASVKRMEDSVAVFSDRILQLNKSFNPINKVVEAVTTSTKDSSGKVTFGSSADALAGREDELSIPQIDSVLASGNVSAEQKAVLEAVKDLKVRKSTQEVSKNIEEFSDGKQISMKDHLASITTAITLGNKAQAEVALAKLKKFATEYAVKAKNVADAWARVEGKAETEVVPQIAPKETLEIRGITYDEKPSSKGLVGNIASDNALIQAKFLQAQNHFNVAFKGKTNAPQATQTVTPKAQQSQVPATTTAVVKNLNGVAAVNAAEAAGEGISTLRKDGNQHYGNPFTSRTTPTTAEIKVSSVKEAVDAYRAWLRGTAHQQVRPEQRTWILAQIAAGALDGKTLLYYTQLNEPSHADALAEFVNTPKNETGSSSEPAVATASLVISESTDSGYSARTKRNADKGDITIGFAVDHNTAGERLTQKLAGNKMVKSGDSLKAFATEIVAKLKAVNGTSINVAGNGIYTWAQKAGKTQDQINTAMYKILKSVKEQYPELTTIITGGQTGSDIAGAVAGVALGLAVDVHMPKGFRQRDVDGKDFTQTVVEVETYIKNAAKKVTLKEPTKSSVSPTTPKVTSITKGKYTPVRTDRLSLTVLDNNPTYTFGETLFTKDDNPLETVAAVFDKDSDALQVLQDIAKSISSSTDSTIQYHPDQNPLIDFMEDDGKTVFQSNGKPKLILNKAIVNAAAIVGFNYIGSRSGSLLLNSMKTIKQMFGFQDEERLPFETAEAMRFIGKNRNAVADDLGAEIYAMLGMSVKGSVERKRIQHALGFIAIRGLVAQGYLEEKYIEKNEYDGFFKPEREGEESIATGERSNAPKVAFVHAVMNTDISSETDPIETIQETEDIKALFTPEVKKELKKLLPTVRSNEIDPITNPKDTVIPKTLSNSNQVLTEVAKKAVETANARPYSLNRSVYDKFMELYNNADTQDALLKSVGYKFGTEALQIYNRITAEDNNKLILKQIADLQSYVEALPNPDTLVYFNHDIWANQRIGLNTGSGISPQGSKLIRHMFTLDSAKIEIDPSTQGTLASKEFLKEVRRSIAQGFGADGGKLQEEQIDEQYNLLLQDPHIVALRANPNDSAALLAVLDDHGEGTHTFEAVMSLIALENGLNGKTPFSLTTMVEVDGKTNGLGIAMAQFFGVSQDALSTVLDAVGLFQDPKKEHYVESMVGKPDLYQGLARETAVIVAAKRREADNNLWRIQEKYVSFLKIEELINPKIMKQAREIVKYPLMTVVFGKAITTLKRDFGELLFQLMIDKVEKADLAGIQEINADIEGLTGIKDAFPTEKWLEHKLPDGTIRDIVASMSETYGASVAEAIEAKFAPLYAMRNVLNKAANTVSDIFIAAVAKKTKDRMLTKEYLKELMETPIAEGGLQEFLPAFHTVHSKNLNEGFLVLDIEQARANDANPVQVTYGPGGSFSPIPGSVDTFNHPISATWKKASIAKTEKPKQYSHTGNITQIKLDNAGVGALIGFIHSFDGALMQSFLTQVEAFGVHDAAYMNPHNSPEGRKLMNTLFIEQHNNYSIAESINNRYLEVMELLNKHPDLVDLDSRKIRKNMEELAAGTNKVEPLALTVSRIKEVRARELPKIVNVAQFAAPNSGVKNPNSNVKDVEVPAEMSMEDVMQSMIDEVINEPTKTGPYQRRTPEPRSLISAIQSHGGLTINALRDMFGASGKDYNWLKGTLSRKKGSDTASMAEMLQQEGIINPGREDPAQYLESLIVDIASGSKVYADMDGAASYNYEQEILSQANTLGIPTNRKNIEDIKTDLELLNNLADALAQDPKNKDQLIAAFRCRRKGK